MHTYMYVTHDSKPQTEGILVTVIQCALHKIINFYVRLTIIYILQAILMTSCVHQPSHYFM